jgi:hypothetical protein
MSNGFSGISPVGREVDWKTLICAVVFIADAHTTTVKKEHYPRLTPWPSINLRSSRSEPPKPLAELNPL